MIPVCTRVDVEHALVAGKALVFKHSTSCPISREAFTVMNRWIQTKNPDIDIFCVNVIENRAESEMVALETGIRHESPQVILIVDGRPVWSATHWNITEDALERALKGG